MHFSSEFSNFVEKRSEMFRVSQVGERDTEAGAFVLIVQRNMGSRGLSVEVFFVWDHCQLREGGGGIDCVCGKKKKKKISQN